jgi:hypothetical protein
MQITTTCPESSGANFVCSLMIACSWLFDKDNMGDVKRGENVSASLFRLQQ